MRLLMVHLFLYMLIMLAIMLVSNGQRKGFNVPGIDSMRLLSREYSLIFKHYISKQLSMNFPIHTPNRTRIFYVHHYLSLSKS